MKNTDQFVVVVVAETATQVDFAQKAKMGEQLP
jgi:hypothetical protein